MKEASENIMLLALDDDKDDLLILEDIFKEYNVSRYALHTDKEKFFEDAASNMNVIITDHKMVLDSGLEITKQIKDINPDNYIIVTTVMENIDVVIDYLNAGANKFLKKLDIDYRKKLEAYLREGFGVVRKRIEAAKEREDYYRMVRAHSKRTDEIISKIR